MSHFWHDISHQICEKEAEELKNPNQMKEKEGSIHLVLGVLGVTLILIVAILLIP